METHQNDEVILFVTEDGRLSKKVIRSNHRNGGPKIIWMGRKKFEDRRNYAALQNLNVVNVIVSDDKFGDEAETTLGELIRAGSFPAVPIQKITKIVRLGNVI